MKGSSCTKQEVLEELKDLARDHDIEIGRQQRKKRLKTRRTTSQDDDDVNLAGLSDSSEPVQAASDTESDEESDAEAELQAERQAELQAERQAERQAELQAVLFPPGRTVLSANPSIRENEEDEEVFDVLKCLDKRTKNGTVEYLVRCECAGCCAAIESCPLLLLTGPCVPPRWVRERV